MGYEITVSCKELLSKSWCTVHMAMRCVSSSSTRLLSSCSLVQGYSSPVSSISTHPYLSQMLSGCVDGSILLHSVSHSQPVKVLKEGSTPDEVNKLYLCSYVHTYVPACNSSYTQGVSVYCADMLSVREGCSSVHH